MNKQEKLPGFFCIYHEHQDEKDDESSEAEDLCLRMEKTKAQMQSIAKAVQQTPTFTISIPPVYSLQGAQVQAQAEVLVIRQDDDTPSRQTLPDQDGG